MAIFKTRGQREAFRSRFHRTWVALTDRSCYLDYDADWGDVQGFGLTLATSDYPQAAYGGRRASELAGR